MQWHVPQILGRACLLLSCRLGEPITATQMCIIGRFSTFLISGFLDMRKTLPDTLQDFNFQILKSQHFQKMLRMPTNNCHVYRFEGPPRAVRWVVSACGASATSEKTRPWNFGTCILCFLSIVLIVHDFVGFRVSQPCASVWWLPAALRRPQKKHAPGILEYASCGFQQKPRRINGNSTTSYQ